MNNRLHRGFTLIEHFDLLSESENESAKSKIVSGAAGKAVPGGRRSGGK